MRIRYPRRIPLIRNKAAAGRKRWKIPVRTPPEQGIQGEYDADDGQADIGTQQEPEATPCHSRFKPFGTIWFRHVRSLLPLIWVVPVGIGRRIWPSSHCLNATECPQSSAPASPARKRKRYRALTGLVRRRPVGTGILRRRRRWIRPANIPEVAAGQRGRPSQAWSPTAIDADQS